MLEQIEEWAATTACPGEVFVDAVQEPQFKINVWMEGLLGEKHLVAEVVDGRVIPGEGRAGSWAWELEDHLRTHQRQKA